MSEHAGMAGTKVSESRMASVVPLEGAGGRTLTEAAYMALRNDIIAGVRPPQERLRIDRLKQLYNIGPTPLREALQRLAADGLVIAVGNRGFSVAPLDAAEFEDLNVARTAIETQAARLSIARGDAEWEAGVAGAAYRIAKADAALKSDSAGISPAWEVANDHFHWTTVSACGSDWLLRARATINDQCARYRRASVALRRQDRDLEAEHRAIAEAVLARNADAACSLIEAHFQATTRTLVAELSG